jgi:hypothetical protein
MEKKLEKKLIIIFFHKMQHILLHVMVKKVVAGKILCEDEMEMLEKFIKISDGIKNSSPRAVFECYVVFIINFINGGGSYETGKRAVNMTIWLHKENFIDEEVYERRLTDISLKMAEQLMLLEKTKSNINKLNMAMSILLSTDAPIEDEKWADFEKKYQQYILLR